jgi:hypothetical protein
MVSGTFPDEVRVTDWAVAVLSRTAPNERVAALRVSAGVAGISCRDAVLVTPPAIAVMVTVWAAVTADAAALKAAVVAPLRMVTDDGTVTALLLPARLTVRPLVAGEVRLTVQASVPAPMRDPTAQDTELSAGGIWPVAPRLTVAVAPAAALVVMVRVPAAAPAVAGSKFTCSVSACPGFRVIGRLSPDRANPVPFTEAPLMTSEAFPEEVTEFDRVAVVFTGTVPNAMEVALSAIPGVLPGVSCRISVAAYAPEVAVRVTVCGDDTAAIVAVNFSL